MYIKRKQRIKKSVVILSEIRTHNLPLWTLSRSHNVQELNMGSLWCNPTFFLDDTQWIDGEMGRPRILKHRLTSWLVIQAQLCFYISSAKNLLEDITQTNYKINEVWQDMKRITDVEERFLHQLNLIKEFNAKWSEVEVRLYHGMFDEIRLFQNYCFVLYFLFCFTG